jgi:hypothetical protein
MCERHSQAPPTLASPKLETTDEKEGRSGLIANTGLPSPLVQRYPEPARRKRQRVALRRRMSACMSCGEAQSNENALARALDFLVGCVPRSTSPFSQPELVGCRTTHQLVLQFPVLNCSAIFMLWNEL